MARLLAKRGIRTEVTAFRGGADPRGIFTVLRAVKRESPDWIVTNRGKLYWTVWGVARIMRIRVAVFRHLPHLKRWLSRQVLPRIVDGFFVVSQYARDRLVHHGTPCGRIDVLYNPIDIPPEFDASEVRAHVRVSIGVPQSSFIVGFVGRVVRDKGIHVLWAAMAPLMATFSDIHLLCVGDGPDLAEWRRTVRSAGLQNRCHFLQWTEDLAFVYPALDVLAAPSVEPETFCRVIAEAQMSGIAVIGARIGGIPEALVEESSGILVSPQNAPHLRRAIERLYLNRQLCAQFAECGRQNARTKFATHQIATQFALQLSAKSR